MVIGDGSDDPNDLVAFYHKLESGYDCVFGSLYAREPDHRLSAVETDFGPAGESNDPKPVSAPLQRCHQRLQALSAKLYRRSAIAGIQPLLSHHFNLTVELPLKCIIRGYRYAVLPNSWKNRQEGISKLRIKEMGSRYLFIILYCWLERMLSRGDYRDQEPYRETQLQVWHR